MVSDLVAVRRQVRRAYELGRARRALIGSLPILLVVAAAVCFTHRLDSTLAFGIAAALLGVTALWFGRNPQRAVLPGVAIGLVPLILALCANHWHHCGPDGCSTWCVPACGSGGLIAGIAIAKLGAHKPVGYWLSASSLALLTGAMGCACVGYSGVLGLGLGFGGGTLLVLLRRLWTRQPV